MAVFNFDATQYTPKEPNLGPIPAGKYTAVITASSIEQNRSGTGDRLKLEFTICSGEFANRKIFENLNIRHQSATAQEIAQRTLSTICHAVGVRQLADTNQLHGIPMLIKVEIRKDPNYGDKNEIKAYAAAPQRQQTPPVYQTQQQARASYTPANNLDDDIPF